MNKPNSKLLTALPVELSNGTRHFCAIHPEHLKAFGIIENLVPELVKAHSEVLHTEQQDGCFLSDFERAETMCLGRFRPEKHLAFNQCFRWELMLSVFRELVQIEKSFGDGEFDLLGDDEHHVPP